MIKNILIVDDAPVTVEMVKRQIEKEGIYTVFIAGNGREGLDVVLREEIDLIVTDVVMPVMDGVDFFRELKKIPETLNIPIIIITDSVIIKESFKQLGVNDFIRKPFDGKVVLDRIKKIDELHIDRKKNERVLLVGNNRALIKEMSHLLKDKGCNVAISDGGIDVVSKSLRMVPKLLIIDVMLQDISAIELIKALRCFIKLNNLNIVIFSHFLPGEYRITEIVEQMNEFKNACINAGATNYIGRYSPLTFIDRLRESDAL